MGAHLDVRAKFCCRSQRFENDEDHEIEIFLMTGKSPLERTDSAVGSLWF